METLRIQSLTHVIHAEAFWKYKEILICFRISYVLDSLDPVGIKGNWLLIGLTYVEGHV